jgi:hypothetical protein
MRVLAVAALLAPAAVAQVRVEPRVFVKERHTFLSGGLTWLERGDYYNNPGVVFSGSYYLRESDALEVRAVLFASWLGASADEVVRGTGLVPDSQRPISLILGGWRHSLTYGKVALAGSVVHFDVQGGFDAGTLITNRALNPAAGAFAGVVARLSDRVYGQLDVTLLGTLESRSTSVFTVGILPVLTIGGWL